MRVTVTTKQKQTLGPDHSVHVRTASAHIAVAVAVIATIFTSKYSGYSCSLRHLFYISHEMEKRQLQALNSAQNRIWLLTAP